ncbi:MAG: hypothetical protein BGO31_10925 [Bacteroidetes bacterium 43-16]|uniref:hypothetical protein n=1 Tax=uncultured Dysgonomonas sp. TaxID=206096 RepID=UPI000925C463|nr:hypothetical protein [uncultured Dysgonomonas sp.]OJV50972.1 MAG: hypothetical protein BGO31_10925 [Bacteroidetes bacterium 43-16]
MKEKNVKRLVLGEGETIGHKHVLDAPAGMEYERTDDHIRILLKGTGVLTHDEHDRMVFEAGSMLRSYNQVEFNPMDNTVNRVFD